MLVLSVLWTSLSYGQDMIHFRTVDFQPIKATNYTDIQGSPYFMNSDIYKKGVAVISKDQIYKDDIKLLYNQLTDEVTFLYEGETPMAFSKRPISFIIFSYDMEGARIEEQFESGFKSSKDPKGIFYYQVLVGANTKLLKRTIKILSERKGYGESTVKKVFESKTKYFLFGKEGKLEDVSSYKDFARLGREMATFIDQNKLKKNSEENFVTLTNYYNSLK